MDILADRLKQRAKQLGISNAEAARRCRLDERRYAHYASGRREPDLATLVQIATTLNTTPNWLLGLDADGKAGSAHSSLLDRLALAAQNLEDRELRALVLQAEALTRSEQADLEQPGR